MSYATSLVPACQHLADVLTAAGVPASLDRSSLQIPGAWITPGTARQLTLSGAGRARVSVLLVVPATGDLEALEALSVLLDKALTVVTPDEDVDTSVLLPIRNNPLPAFRLAVDLTLEES
jgi:hypothetical protein